MTKTASAKADDLVLRFLTDQNRPHHAQNVTDALQREGLKKAAVEKSLKALADSDKITLKEYGKAKIYLAKQDNLEIPSVDDLKAMDEEISVLQSKSAEVSDRVSTLEKEVNQIISAPLNSEVEQQTAELERETAQMQKKLDKLAGGTVLVSVEERDSSIKSLEKYLKEWKCRKRNFKDLQDEICEGTNKKPEEFREILGTETDEEFKNQVDLNALQSLVPQRKRKPLR